MCLCKYIPVLKSKMLYYCIHVIFNKFNVHLHLQSIKLLKQPFKFNRKIWHAQSLATDSTDIAFLNPLHIKFLEVYCSVTVSLKIHTVNLLGSVKTNSYNSYNT
jgi:Ni/Fe-hydrogenase subunit HybB-like protein